MVSSIFVSKLDSNKLSKQYKKMNTMKWLLSKGDDEASFQDLQNQIDEICHTNISHLIIINHYLSQLSPNIYNSAQKVITAKSNKRNREKAYLNYLRDCRKAPEFQEFETYISIHRGNEAMLDVQDFDKVEAFERYNVMKEKFLEYKVIQLCLLFNIINDEPLGFQQLDILENLPQLLNWIEENKVKPIKNLTKDECEILSAHIYNFTYERMLTDLNLSKSVRDYSDINQIIQGLPEKFNVSNMTQVMFKIILLKPYIWQQRDHKSIVKAIKGVSKNV